MGDLNKKQSMFYFLNNIFIEENKKFTLYQLKQCDS